MTTDTEQTDRQKSMEEVAESRAEIQRILDESEISITTGTITDYEVVDDNISLTVETTDDVFHITEPLVQQGQKSAFVEYIEDRLEVNIQKPDELLGEKVKIASHDGQHHLFIQTERELYYMDKGLIEYGENRNHYVRHSKIVWGFIFGGIVASVIFESIAMFVLNSVALTLTVALICGLISITPFILSARHANYDSFELEKE